MLLYGTVTKMGRRSCPIAWLSWPMSLSVLQTEKDERFPSYMVITQKAKQITMSNQPAIPLADAVETFVTSLRQRAVPLNTIKSYAHDLHLFVQAMPADLVTVTSEQIQTFLTSDEHHSW